MVTMETKGVERLASPERPEKRWEKEGKDIHLNRTDASQCATSHQHFRSSCMI